MIVFSPCFGQGSFNCEAKDGSIMKSMTAYARVEGTVASLPYVLELKSVNHRFLDIHLHVPPQFYAFEIKIHNAIKDRCCRGKIDVWVRSAKNSLSNTQGIAAHVGIDGLSYADILDQARDIGGLLRDIQEASGFAGEPTLSHLLQFKGFLSAPMPNSQELESHWPEFTRLLDLLLDEADTFKKREGDFLCREFDKMIDSFKKCVDHIVLLAPSILSTYKDRLTQRLTSLLSEGAPLNAALLENEMALFAERCDITEETTRLYCHLDRFRDHLQEPNAVGRKLDFLLQEMNREINTIGSKGNDAQISQHVVDCKLMLEKIREQIQNIE